MYVIKEEWEKDVVYGERITVFTDKSVAKLEMLKQLKEEIGDGYITEFKEMEGFVEESYDCHYECFVEPQAETNHYSISVKTQELKMSPCFIENIKKGSPGCFTPESNNPYPLCIGGKDENCENCCLYINMKGEGGLDRDGIPM